MQRALVVLGRVSRPKFLHRALRGGRRPAEEGQKRGRRAFPETRAPHPRKRRFEAFLRAVGAPYISRTLCCRRATGEPAPEETARQFRARREPYREPVNRSGIAKHGPSSQE